MGYRLRIGKISKINYRLYGNCETEKEVRSVAGLDDGDSLVCSLPEYTELYELGRLRDEEYSEGTKPFFRFDLGEEEEFCIASKEWLLSLIENYREKVERWYTLLSKAIIRSEDISKKINGENLLSINKELYEEEHVFPSVELFRHINERKQLWEGKYIKPYLIDKESKYISGNWSYEYSVFDLVHILHTFDWENDLMIYSVW